VEVEVKMEVKVEITVKVVLMVSGAKFYDIAIGKILDGCIYQK